MVIHEKGHKAERDRRNFMAKYLEICNLANILPLNELELARFNNRELFRLGEDLWNKLPTKTKTRYLEDKGLIPRSNPLAFKWFIRDRVALFKATGWRWLVVMIMNPFRYPGFLKRSRGVMEK